MQPVYDAAFKQEFLASCAIKCQQIILLFYGIEVSEQQLCELATGYGWYDDKRGVFMHDNGKLLDGFGVHYHHSQNNSLDDIIDEIKRGHKVMVKVNHISLEQGYPLNNEAYHALIINSVNDGYVYVINTSDGIYDEKYEVNLFLSAWGDSSYYMLATDEPAKYTYDPKLGCMTKIDIN